MGHCRIKSRFSYIRFRAFPCPDCGNPPAVEFDQSSQGYKISCCGYSVEAEEAAIVLELWNDFVKEKVGMEDKKEKEPNAVIAPCPKCGQLPAIRYAFDVADLDNAEYVISCCGKSIVLDGYDAAVDAWNEYNLTYQIKTPAEHSQDKISDVVEHLRKILIAKNQNYGNSAFQSPVLLPDLPAEKAIFVRMSDKVARLAQLTSGEKDRVGESIEDTLYDLAGYCVLAIIAMRKGEVNE